MTFSIWEHIVFFFVDYAQMYGIIILFKSMWENGLFWKFKFFVSVSVVSCFHDSKIIYIIIAVPSAKFNLSKYKKTYISSHLLPLLLSRLLLEYCFLQLVNWCNVTENIRFSFWSTHKLMVIYVLWYFT